MKIIFDLETTGFYPKHPNNPDEILQISIISEDGDILINTYVKPVKKTSWPDAQAVNKISPEMVMNAPTLADIKGKVQSIIDRADTFITYNGDFDISFLECAGISIPKNIIHEDVMKMFAPVYGIWNRKRAEYRWQKLTTCAEYFNYSYHAHDSLEDCKATLFCYKRICELDAENAAARQFVAMRKSLNMTQVEWSKKFDIKLSTMQKWEVGTYRVPSYINKMIARIIMLEELADT